MLHPYNPKSSGSSSPTPVPKSPPDQIDKIFDRFYQADTTYKKDAEGTGVGLALTKELVERHHGTIHVESREDLDTNKSGSSTRQILSESKHMAKTIFTVLLPIGKEHLSEDEIADEMETGNRSKRSGDPDLSGKPETERELRYSSPSDVDTSRSEAEIPYPVPSTENRVPSILVVEDNADLRHYILSNMDGQYRFSEAENGEEGFKKAIKDIPDLIISDVMMPKMDGFEFCAKIKTDERTSHIPVILITARAEQEDRIEGLETGADDYITKPFDNKELHIRVKNLIEQRWKLRERFARESNFVIDEIAHTSTDEKFINRVMGIISRHISDSEFNIESLSEQAGLSRMHLHRKILGLFGQTPGEFLRTIRLKQGAKLLKKKIGNIAEIAYEVGFESPAYFSTCFRQQFGLSPSEYIKNHQKA
jgi:DNA-binding response OmpR family regulator